MDSLFERAAIEYSENPAVIFEDQTLTFDALNTKVNQLARILIDKGLNLEQPVAIMMDRSEKLPAVLLAVIRAGGAYLPLDPEHPVDRIQFILDEAEVSCVMIDSAFENKIPSGFNCFHVDAEWSKLDALGEGVVKSKAKPDSLAYIIYTSGSTGKPKGVMVEHHSICNRLLWMQESFELDIYDRVLQKTPYTFDVSVSEFFMPLTTGACLVMARPGGHKETDYLIRVINQYGITILHFVPSMLSLFLTNANASSCSGLKSVICTGEVLSKKHEQLFMSLLPSVDLYNFYGPTEAAVEVSTWHCNQEKSYSFVPIGQAIANTQLHILDDDFLQVPIGSIGELFIAGVQVARGYVNRAALTAERFLPDPFSKKTDAKMYRTGDLVRFHDEGVIEYLGRNDFQVKIRGLRIELGEIENVLLAQQGVSQAVVAAKETKGDMSLIAYAVLENSSTDRETLRNGLSQSLPDYMVPHHFVFIADMPLTSSGKADRTALLKLDVAAVVRDVEEGGLPTTPDQVYLADLWKQFIEIDEIFIEDNFFDIGGHSLLAAKVNAYILNDRGIDIPLRVFITSTLEQIVEHCFVVKGDASNNKSKDPDIIPGTKKQGWVSKLFNRKPKD
jgi:amino acid adenylation domain-containing protein